MTSNPILSFLPIPFSVFDNLSLVVTIFVGGSFCFFNPVLNHDQLIRFCSQRFMLFQKIIFSKMKKF